MRNGVTLRTELASDFPPVFADRVQLQQVILNLVVNGIEATARVTDRARELLITSHRYESDKVLVAVQDSGIGIDPKILKEFPMLSILQSPRELAWAWPSVAHY